MRKFAISLFVFGIIASCLLFAAGPVRAGSHPPGDDLGEKIWAGLNKTNLLVAGNDLTILKKYVLKAPEAIGRDLLDSPADPESVIDSAIAWLEFFGNEPYIDEVIEAKIKNGEINREQYEFARSIGKIQVKNFFETQIKYLRKAKKELESAESREESLEYREMADRISRHLDWNTRQKFLNRELSVRDLLAISPNTIIVVY